VRGLLASLLALGAVVAGALPAGGQGAPTTWRTLVAGDADVYDSLRLPSGVAVDGRGNVYAVDTANSRVQKLSRAGAPLLTLGGIGTGPEELRRPRGVAVDPNNDTVFIADTANFRVQRFAASSGAALGAWGVIGSAPGEFILPEGLTLDADGNLFVADTGNHRVQQLSAMGQAVAIWGVGLLNFPHAVALDPASGDLFVVDSDGLKRLSRTTGELLRRWDAFSDPYGVTFDLDGNLYVADTDHGRIAELSPDGEMLAAWGQPGSGPGQFTNPEAVAVDASGAVYVADRGNNRIQVLVR
jgi:DNA-binding beta-propeller fold protein YncE